MSRAALPRIGLLALIWGSAFLWIKLSVTGWQAAGLIAGFAGAVLIFSPGRATAGLWTAGGLECLAASVS